MNALSADVSIQQKWNSNTKYCTVSSMSCINTKSKYGPPVFLGYEPAKCNVQ